MDMSEVVGLVVSVITSLLSGLVLFYADLEKKPKEPYAERLAQLTESLSKASREVDGVLVELARVATARAQAVQQLETDLAGMESREKELKARIDALEKTPLAVAEHFAKLVAPGEKRSALRDYLLFGTGVIVSTVIQLFVS